MMVLNFGYDYIAVGLNGVAELPVLPWLLNWRIAMVAGSLLLPTGSMKRSNLGEDVI